MLQRIGQVEQPGPGARHRAPDVAEQPSARRVERRQMPVGRREGQQIGLPGGSARRPSEDALLGERMEDGAVFAALTGRTGFFIVEEEERPIAAVPDARNHNRAAETHAGLKQLVFILGCLAGGRIGRQVTVVEPGIGVQVVMLQVEVGAAAEIVAARARRESNLDPALTGVRRILRGHAHRDFLHRVETRADAREKAVSGLQPVVLSAHAVDCDVDGALRQSIDGGIAASGGRVDPGSVVMKSSALRLTVGSFMIWLVSMCRGDRRSLRLDDLGSARDRARSLRAADFQRDPDRGRHRRVDADVVQHGRLESGQGDSHGVGAGIDRGHGKAALIVRRRGELGGGRDALDRHGRAGDDAPRWVADVTAQRRGGAATLSEGRLDANPPRRRSPAMRTRHIVSSRPPLVLVRGRTIVPGVNRRFQVVERSTGIGDEMSGRSAVREAWTKKSRSGA